MNASTRLPTAARSIATIGLSLVALVTAACGGGDEGDGATSSSSSSVVSANGSSSLSSVASSSSSSAASSSSVAASSSSSSAASSSASVASSSTSVPSSPANAASSSSSAASSSASAASSSSSAASSSSSAASSSSVASSSSSSSSSVTTWSIGGSISGLSAAGLVLINNGNGDTNTIGSGASSYVMTVRVALNAAYNVSVRTQPTGLTCTVNNGSGTVASAANVTTLNVSCAPTADTTPPSVPSGLTASAASSTSIQLSWSASTDPAPNATGVAGYRVYRNGSSVGTSTSTSYTDAGLSASTSYSYTVAAYDSATPANQSAQSSSASATTQSGGGGGGGGGAAGSGGGWAWMSGPQKGGTWAFNGQYGSRGVASSGNYPGSRFQNMGWKDPSGNLWMMGGYGSDANGSYGRMDDVWKFDLGSSQWTWVAGRNSAQTSPVYGSQGQSSTNYTPGGRSASAVWSNGSDAYIFGGIWINGFYELMGDLWKFNMNTGEWTWLKGSTSSNTGGSCSGYGVANGNNSPGGRKGAAYWNDGAGNLWLFGGIGYDCGGGQSVMNDLWKYNISGNTWTLVTGAGNGTPSSNFGTQGQAGGTPGGRQDAQFWRDNAGNLWVFGGLDASGSQLNDLWKYSIGSNQWTWMGGSTGTNASGNYGTLGVASGGMPGARRGGAGFFDGTYGWVFGGFGWDGFGNKENLNDLWRYDPSNGQWTWMSGANTTGSSGNYGSLGANGTSTAPPARNDFAFWTDNNGRLWVGQGEGQLSSSNHLADLFRY